MYVCNVHTSAMAKDMAMGLIGSDLVSCDQGHVREPRTARVALAFAEIRKWLCQRPHQR